MLESLRAEPWLNREDFDKALAAARKHYPEPPRTTVPLTESVSRVAPSAPVEPLKPAPQRVDLRVDGGSARVRPRWRRSVR